jgi:hypothetical protein
MQHANQSSHKLASLFVLIILKDFPAAPDGITTKKFHNFLKGAIQLFLLCLVWKLANKAGDTSFKEVPLFVLTPAVINLTW